MLPDDHSRVGVWGVDVAPEKLLQWMLMAYGMDSPSESCAFDIRVFPREWLLIRFLLRQLGLDN